MYETASLTLYRIASIRFDSLESVLAVGFSLRNAPALSGNRGISSNTGITIHRTLLDSLFLLKGLPSDDEQMAQIWTDSSVFPCVLWPGDTALSIEEVKRKKMMNQDSQLLLVVPDGTFSSARRIVNKYPANATKVKLSPNSVLEGKCNSLLYPVRKYGGSEEETGRVSTLEAVAAFMREIGEDTAVAETLISNMKIQMDRVLRQKNRPALYGTIRT